MKTSLRPSDAVEGGGIYDNVNATIINVECVDDHDYDGRITDPSRFAAGVLLTLQPEGGESYEQFYSIGNTSQWTTANGGKGLKNRADDGKDDGKKAPMTTSSNFYMLMESFSNCEPPESFWDRIDNYDIAGALTGVLAFWQQQKQKERAGLENEYTDNRGQKRTRTILLPTSVTSWSTGGGSSAGTSTAKGATESAEVEEAVFEALSEALAEAEDNTLAGADLARWTLAAAKALKGDYAGITSKVVKAIVFDVDKVEEYGLTPSGEGKEYSVTA